MYTVINFIVITELLSSHYTQYCLVCKYLLISFMSSLSAQNKKEVLARLQAFNWSGIQGKVTGNITRNCKSFVGRDFKAWMQVAVFIVHHYLSNEETQIWLHLNKV